MSDILVETVILMFENDMDDEEIRYRLRDRGWDSMSITYATERAKEILSIE